MRGFVAVVFVIAVAASGFSVAATATATKSGLPESADGYAQRRTPSKRPLTAPGAHNGGKMSSASDRVFTKG